MTGIVKFKEENNAFFAKKLCMALEKGGKELSDAAFGFAKNL